MNMRKLIYVIIVICFSFGFIESKDVTDDLVVQLPKGAIRGLSRTSANGSVYYSFQDIPYAAPPVGKNRFQIPKPPESWGGILDTTDNKKVCMASLLGSGAESALQTAQTEDCLYLNVYTPTKPGSNNSLPVYVYIHGGAFRSGDGSYYLYGPKYLMDHDIVVATMNYRLGAFGFLATTDGVIPGNLGLKDQRLALEWIQKNIHLFGGDPKKITVGGESAGGASSGYHLLSKQSKGLFRGNIMQSGSAINTWSFQRYPNKYAFKLGNMLDPTFNSTNSTQLLKVLLKASANDINLASNVIHNEENMDGAVITDLIWAPILEDSLLPNTFISEAMYNSLYNGNFNQVPIMVGFTSEESLSFIQNAAVLDKYIQLFDNDPGLLVNDKFNLDPQTKSIVGNEIWKLYSKNSSFAENISGLVRFSSDAFQSRSLTRLAETSSRYVPTYLYQFSYSSIENNIFPGTGNVGHAMELQFVWDSGFSDNSDFDEVIRQRSLKLWTNFIKYQDPTPTKDPLLQNAVWPKVETGNTVYLDINENFQVGTNPRQYIEVTSIIDKYVNSQLATY